MDTPEIIATVAAIVALGSALFSALQVKQSRKQTDIQLQARRDAVDPRLWADIRPDTAQGTMLNFTLGNSGPTTATNVQVRISPDLPSIPSKQVAVGALVERLEKGLSAVTPGQVHVWSLGQGFELLKEPGPQPVTITIDARGPFGPLETQEYVISPMQWRDAQDSPEGSLHEITKALKKLRK